MLIKLPALELEWKHRSGNFIYHRPDPGVDGDFNIVEQNRSYFVIEKDEIKCCITGNENIIDNTCSHILLLKRSPTLQILENLKEFKRWLKHPLLKNYSPSEVTDTWKGKFNYIEEDLNAGENGLRRSWTKQSQFAK